MRASTKRVLAIGALATALVVPAGIAVAAGDTTAGSTTSPSAPAPGDGSRGMGMGPAQGWRSGGCLGGSAEARELRREHRREMQELRREHRRDMQRLWESR